MYIAPHARKRYESDLAQRPAFRAYLEAWKRTVYNLPDRGILHVRWPHSLWRKRAASRKLVWVSGAMDPKVYRNMRGYLLAWIMEWCGFELVGEPQLLEDLREGSVLSQFNQKTKETNNAG